MSEWREYKLGDLISLLTDYHSNGSYKTLKANVELLDEDSYAVMIRTKNFEQNDFSKELKYIDEHAYNHLAKSKVYPDDIIMNKIANAGSIYRMPDLNRPVSLAMNLFLIRFNEKETDQVFMYYYLKQNERYIKTFAEGSVTKTITKNAVRNLDVIIPAKKEQLEIVNTLNNLDQKNTLLQEQNQTLEELAQTLFKRWFVEFEFPDENGNPYKSSGGKMVDSELGEIPEGWRVGEVSDFVKHSTKSITPSKEPEKIFSHYSIPAFDSGRYPTKDIGESILSNKYLVLENSILVSKLNPRTSRIWTVFKPHQNSICSTEIQVFIPKKNTYAFSFGMFHTSGVKKEMAQRASGTSSSHQRVRPSDILNIEMVVPKDEVLKNFESSILGSLKKIEANQEEVQSLTQLRDSLLPKLMSGELRVN